MTAHPKVRCAHRDAKGVQCKAWAQAESEWCWAHNPDGRAQQQAERTKQMEREGRFR